MNGMNVCMYVCMYVVVVAAVIIVVVLLLGGSSRRRCGIWGTVRYAFVLFERCGRVCVVLVVLSSKLVVVCVCVCVRVWVRNKRKGKEKREELECCVAGEMS